MERNRTNQENTGVSFNQILEAIAKGVEARLKRILVLNIVTLETIRIARKLHIPEEEIQEWRTSRFYRSESIEPPFFLRNTEEEK